MCSDPHTTTSTDQEEVSTPAEVWKDLEPHAKEKALRILTDLCHAYITESGADLSPEYKALPNCEPTGSTKVHDC